MLDSGFGTGKNRIPVPRNPESPIPNPAGQLFLITASAMLFGASA